MSDPTSKDRIRVVPGDFFVHESAVKEYLGGNLRKYSEDQPRDERGRFGEGGGLAGQVADRIKWEGSRVTVAHGGTPIPLKLESGPYFLSTDPNLAVSYYDSDKQGHDVATYTLDKDKLLVEGSRDWDRKFGEKYDHLGPELYSDPPKEVLSYVKERGLAGFATSDGQYVRIENPKLSGIKRDKSFTKTSWSDGLRKAPDDALRGRVEEIIAALDLGDWSILVDELAPDLAEAWAAGVEGAMPLVGFTSDETINEARALFGLGEVAGGDVAPSIVNLVNERSVEWAEQHAADLVTQIEENTRDMLRATIVEAIEEGWGAEQLGDEIADSAGFSDYRAEMIGRTEVIAANNEGNLALYRESGVATGKEWLTAQDDLVEEDCQENENEGPIGLDEDFPSGDASPPAHPNCRCTLLPVVEPLDEEE